MAPLDPGEQISFPELLPGGGVLVTVLPTQTSFVFQGTVESPAARIEAVDLRTGARKTLIRGGGSARYAPTGHLVYSAGRTLQAVAFDVERLEVHGEPVQVTDENDSSDHAMSSDGSLIPGRPVKLIEGGRFSGAGPTGSSQTYDVARDGRFLMLKVATTGDASLGLVHNWFEELKRRAPRDWN